MSKQPDVSWTKAEKAYPKKSATVVSFLNPKLDSKTSVEPNGASNKCQKKPTFKDLCDEDKLRMANLIKELAKIAEEKKEAERRLEEERQKRENDLKEVLRQQEGLLAEKESLEARFTKTQLKLAELKIKLKCERNVTSIPKKANDPKSKRPESNVDNSDSDNKRFKDIFSPNKSSTPNNLSPRSISPIAPVNLAAENDVDGAPTQNHYHPDSNNKRLDIVQQRLDLMAEHKSLRELLEQQERILREKQEEILLQQKLHRERLEEMARIKFENEREVLFRKQQQELLLQQQQQQQQFTDGQNLEQIASLVYKKLLKKRHENSSEEPKRNKTKNSTSSSDMNNDDELIDLIISEKNLINKKPNSSIDCSNEDEESKLIEDLFFIK